MRSLLIAAALLLTAPIPAMAQAPAATLEQTIPELDGFFRQYQQGAHVPGVIYGIVQDGRLVHTTALDVHVADER